MNAATKILLFSRKIATAVFPIDNAHKAIQFLYCLYLMCCNYCQCKEDEE